MGFTSAASRFKSAGSAAMMFREDTVVRVVTLDAVEGKSVLLREVVEDPAWAAAVDASPLKEHFLTAMPFDAFAAEPAARSLSYRVADGIELPRAVVKDPAGVLTETRGGFFPRSCLDVPVATREPLADGWWSHMYVDFLDHLCDATAASRTLVRTASHCDVTVLPAYFLSGDLDAVDDALGRAWCGGEISLAGLDRHALNALMNACVAKTREQTRGEKWNHGDCDLVGVKTLARLVGRRYAAAKRFGRGGERGTGASDARAAIEWHARVHKLEGIATDVTAGDDEDACAAKLETFVDVLAGEQLPVRDAEENLETLRSQPALAWCVLTSYARSKCFEKTQLYVAGIGPFAYACGIALSDPLGTHKVTSKFHPGLGQKLRFVVSDVDLRALNDNHSLLRWAWAAMSYVTCEKEFQYTIPDVVEGRVVGERNVVEWSLLPPGMSTLGFGPVATSYVRNARLKFGAYVGIDFSRSGPRVSRSVRRDSVSSRRDSVSSVSSATGGESVIFSNGILRGLEKEEEEDADASPDDAGDEAYLRRRDESDADVPTMAFYSDVSTFGKAYAGFQPGSAHNISAAESEKDSKAAAEFERTIANLWKAWLKDYDTDGSKTISLDELRAFASLPKCPSSDGYMGDLWTWASEAEKDGTLEEAFKTVDEDGSGELEYPEFYAMLAEED